MRMWSFRSFFLFSRYIVEWLVLTHVLLNTMSNHRRLRHDWPWMEQWMVMPWQRFSLWLAMVQRVPSNRNWSVYLPVMNWSTITIIFNWIDCSTVKFYWVGNTIRLRKPCMTNISSSSFIKVRDDRSVRVDSIHFFVRSFWIVVQTDRLGNRFAPWDLRQ